MATKEEIGVKNTKNEILDAYHEALEKLKEAKSISKHDVKQAHEKQDTVLRASQHSPDDIVKNIAELKLALVKSLEGLESQLLNEHKKLSGLQQAIALQSKDLEELYEIKANADTLAALLRAQVQNKTLFEKEMGQQRQAFEEEVLEKKALWKQEQVNTINAWKEQESEQKKVRAREEEVYLYTQGLERQKESDRYLAQKQALEKELTDKKAALEKEFSAREAVILQNEQELERLRAHVAAFPGQLQQAVAETEQSTRDHLQFKHDYEVKLTQKEVEGERKLHQQMIAALEAKIIQQAQQIKELTEKSNYAGTQVQEIAVKAIEGASRQLFPFQHAEKSPETLKT